MKELEVKIRELGEKESAEREALKEEITGRLDQKVGDLASEVSLALNLSNVKRSFIILLSSQIKARVDMITQQMESDQAWTKNRLDDLGRLVMIVVM